MKGLRFSVIFSVCLLVLGIPLGLRADGMVIPRTAYAVPDIPDQRALIHYANGTETLVIETSFTGPGTNFAWIVPLPAVPKIEPVSTSLFPTLQTIFQPEIVLSVGHYWLALPIWAGVFWLGRVVSRERLTSILLLLLLLAFFSMLLLPTLGPAGTRGMSQSTVAGVRILNRQNVGLFDTALIKSSNPAALMGWLAENGFSAPANIAPVVADYVREGWVFAAAKLASEAGEAGPRATHPLAFTFKTPRPVYPLRLTAKGTASCHIDLYVLGPGRAYAPGFAVQRCEAPKYRVEMSRPRMQAGELQIRHQELAKLVAGAPAATKLSAVLTDAGMARDAYLSWGACWPSGGKVYTRGAALTLSANVSALVFLGLALTGWILARVKTGFKAAQWRQWFVPVSLAAGVLVYALGLTTVSASSYRTSRVWRVYAALTTRELAGGLAMQICDSNVPPDILTSPRPLTPAELNRLFATLVVDFQKAWPHGRAEYHPLTNFFTGETIRFEPSPGNVVLRPTVNAKSKLATGYELVWHDLDGAEALTVPVPWAPVSK